MQEHIYDESNLKNVGKLGEFELIKGLFYFKFKILFVVTLISVIFGFMYIILTKPRYSSSFSFMLNIQTYGEAFSLFVTNPLADVNTNMQIFKSGVVLGKLVDDFNLRVVDSHKLREKDAVRFNIFKIKDKCKKGNYRFIFEPDGYEIYRGNRRIIEQKIPYSVTYEDSFFVLNIEKVGEFKQVTKRIKIISKRDAVKALEKSIKAKQIGKSFVFNVRVLARDSVLSKDMADSLLCAYKRITEDFLTGKARNVKQVLEASFQKIDSALVDYQRRLVKLQDSVGVLKFFALARPEETQKDVFMRLGQLEYNKIYASIYEAEKQISFIDSVLRLLEKRYKDVPVISVEYQRIMVGLQSLIDGYKILRTRYYEVTAQEAHNRPVIAVLEYPSIPQKPSFPRKKLVLALSLFFGVFFGSIFMFIGFVFDNKVKFVTDVLPYFDREYVLKFPPVEPSSHSARKNDWESESFVNLLSNKVLNLIENSPKIPVIAFCSSKEGDGKTRILQVVSEKLVTLGKRILVIDLDFKNPTLSKSLLCAESKIEIGPIKFVKYACETYLSNLYVVPIQAVNKEMLLSLSDMDLEQFREFGFDAVFLDTASVLSSSFILPLFSKVNTTVFVVRVNNTTTKMIEDSLIGLYPYKPQFVVLNEYVDLENGYFRKLIRSIVTELLPRKRIV